MLEGQEVKKEYDGGAGVFVVDVDDKGGVSLSNTYTKDFDGLAKLESKTSVDTNIFILAEKIASKTASAWDDAAIKGLKTLLGIKSGP